jgi:hypothetical protein
MNPMAKNPIFLTKKDVEKSDVDAGDEKRPKNLPANAILTEGFGLEIDGKMKSQHESSDAAMKAGLELKKRFPVIQVKVLDAKEQTRTVVELPK